MQHRARRVFVAAATAAAMASLTGCSLPFMGSVAAPTITATPLPAAPRRVLPPQSPTGPAPVLANSGANWAPMLAGLLTYSQWLLANPSTGTVATVAAAGCPLAGRLTTEVTNLSGEGWRLAPAPLTLSSVGIPAALAPGETRVTLALQASRGAESIVDATGLAASEVGALPPTSFDVTLVLGGDGKWRLCSAQPSRSAGASAGPSLL